MQNDLKKLIAECESSALYAWSHGLEHCNEFAQILYICPTNTCNHNCCYCARHVMRKGLDAQGQKQRGIMSWDTFTRTVASLPLEGRRVYLQKFGESLLHPRIAEMFEYIRLHRPSYELAVHTNATRLKGALAHRLMSTVNHLSLSVYGIDREGYKKAHGKDDFSLVMENLRLFHEEYVKATIRPEVFIYFLRTEHNAHYSDEDVYTWFGERFPTFTVGIYDVFNFQNFVPGIEVDISEHLAGDKFPRCVIPYTLMTVLWDGKVGYCLAEPLEKTFMGDIAKSSLQEIWNGNEYRKFRLMHSNRQWEQLDKLGIYCQRCNWLFSLPSNSMENICLLHKKDIAHKRAHQSPAIVVTSLQNIEEGLWAYLQGDLATALKSFRFAQIASTSSEQQALAKAWEQNCMHVLDVRKNVDAWDEAFKKMGKDLSTFMVTRYRSEQRSAKLDQRFVAKGDINIKKNVF